MQTATPKAPGVIRIDRSADATAGPAAIYQALKNQREVLGDQLGNLESQRRNLNQELQRGTVQGVSKTGVERRISEVDGRISDLSKQIAGADAQISQVAAIPGAVVRPMEIVRTGPPDEAWVLGAMFMVIALLPMSIAMARRVWKKTNNSVAAIPPDLMARLARIEQAVDTSALEIERIGEGQRFITKLFSESKVPALPPGRDHVS